MGERKRVMEGRKRGKREKGKGKGKGRKKEGKQGKASGEKNSRSLARLSWPRLLVWLALLGVGQVWQRLSPILPFRLRSLILIFRRRCSSPACTQSPLATSQILSPPHCLVRQSHVRSLRRQLTECSLPHSSFDAYFHPCLFLPRFFPQICPIQLDASPSFGTNFPFRLPNVDPSQNLSLQNVVYALPATTSIMTIMNGSS